MEIFLLLVVDLRMDGHNLAGVLKAGIKPLPPLSLNPKEFEKEGS